MLRLTSASSFVLFLVLNLCGTVAAQNKNIEKKENDAGKVTDIVTNSIGIKMVLIPSGEFMMGSLDSADELVKIFYAYGTPKRATFEDTYPRHLVRITKPFYLGMYPVTKGQFCQFVNDTGYKTDSEKGAILTGALGIDPKTGRGETSAKYSWKNAGFEQSDDHPVINVSWNDAVAFCEWLSRKENKTYRLPTEAEWEYACRAGTDTRYYSGDDPETLARVSNVADAAARVKFPEWTTISTDDGYVFTSPVGQFEANTFNLYDMHGNVWQWCSDWYEPEYYGSSPIDNPTGPSSGSARVIRGGAWNALSYYVLSASRRRRTPEYRDIGIGLRVVRTP